MNFSCLGVAFMGIFLMCASATAQTPAGPDAGQGSMLVASGDALAYDPCPTRDVLAQSKFSVTCHTGTDDFFERLSAACMLGRPKQDMACGVMMYVLDPGVSREYANQKRLPLLVTIRIAQVYVPKNDTSQIRGVAIKSNGASEHMTAGDLSRLLAPIRAKNLIRDYPDSREGRARKDETVRLEESGVYYYPALFVPYHDSLEAMAPEARDVHFRLEVHIVDDVRAMLEDMYRLSVQN
jgi:hypothetical protein